LGSEGLLLAVALLIARIATRSATQTKKGHTTNDVVRGNPANFLQQWVTADHNHQQSSQVDLVKALQFVVIGWKRCCWQCANRNLKSAIRKGVWVQVPPRAPTIPVYTRLVANHSKSPDMAICHYLPPYCGAESGESARDSPQTHVPSSNRRSCGNPSTDTGSDKRTTAWWISSSFLKYVTAPRRSARLTTFGC